MFRHRFSNYLHLLYPNQLEVKDTTDTQMSAFYIDLGIDNGGILKSKCYDKRRLHFSNLQLIIYQ